MTRLILVLGMHRSGTSLVAGAMPCLGASLGDRAHWSGPDNPDFNEDLDVLALNDSFLQGNGKAWLTADLGALIGFPTFGALWLLETKLAGHEVFVLKEPRMCRLLPFWRPVFDTARCEVSVVEVVRHPMAVARSLHARNALSIQHGLALWVDHVRRARAEADPTWPWVTVSYTGMIADPLRELGRIASGLDLSIQRDGLVQFLRDGVRRDLKHHDGWGDLPPDVAEEWAMACARAVK